MGLALPKGEPDMMTPSSNSRTGGAGGTRTRDLSQGANPASSYESATAPTFAGTFWQRHQHILRLQRDHHGELNELGVRLLERAARASFDDYQDVRREGLCGPLGVRRG